jgi:cell division protein ZapE
MREVHGELAKHQKTVEEIGAEYAAKYEYMVLDEVMVDSVQDAVVLPRLLTELLRRGVAMIMTSNRRPDELYEDGLNRHLYLPPLVESLRVGCRLVNVDYGGWGEVDYRTRGAAGRGRYVEVEEAWRTLWTEEAAGQTTESRAWKIPGSSTRSMKMEVIRTAVRMNVEELCYGEKYGEFDYVELAEWLVKEKKRLYVGKVKKLKKDEAANEGRMLGRLIETMYDAGVEMRVYGDKREEIFKKIIEEGGEVEIKGINSQQLVEAARRAQSRLSELQQ